jgi:hypothetical protein
MASNIRVIELELLRSVAKELASITQQHPELHWASEAYEWIVHFIRNEHSQRTSRLADLSDQEQRQEYEAYEKRLSETWERGIEYDQNWALTIFRNSPQESQDRRNQPPQQPTALRPQGNAAKKLVTDLTKAGNFYLDHHSNLWPDADYIGIEEVRTAWMNAWVVNPNIPVATATPLAVLLPQASSRYIGGSMGEEGGSFMRAVYDSFIERRPGANHVSFEAFVGVYEHMGRTLRRDAPDLENDADRTRKTMSQPSEESSGHGTKRGPPK